jgi:uncharacterized damage-inducible protein DinB
LKNKSPARRGERFEFRKKRLEPAFERIGFGFRPSIFSFQLIKSMTEQIIKNYLSDAIESFRSYKQMAEKAMAQISDEEFFRSIDEEANSVAVIVKHMAGNLRSRWTDFLTSDGEKPDRRRDTEFEMINDTRESLMQFWEAGWQTLFGSIEPLTAEDFGRFVTIRGEPHTICEALNRQMTHYAYHVGQIVLLSKHFRSSDWKTLSVPKNKSAEFNQFLAEKEAKGNRFETASEFADKESE